jgi:hypothetical protein
MPPAPHSPSPWTASGGLVSDANGKTVCEITPPLPNDGLTFDANRALIVSAPDMLEALKEAEFLLSQVLGHQGVTLTIIRTVISKAEG